jgi:hypothetical protein
MSDTKTMSDALEPAKVAPPAMAASNPALIKPRGVPEGSLFHGLFQRVINRQGRISPRMAIKAQCLDCMGLDRRGVAECGDHCCPLWNFRPYRKAR